MSKRVAVQRVRKLPLRLLSVNSLAALVLLFTAGCLIRPERMVRNVPPGEWLATLRNPERAPFRQETAPESAPGVVWRRGTERGLTAAPIVQGDLLILGSTGRVLAITSAINGSEYWHRRFNGPVVGSPLRAGANVAVATASRDGSVYAYTVERGRKRWHRKLHAPVTIAPVYHAGRIYTGTLRGELYGLDADDGDVEWRTMLPGHPVGAPVVLADALLLATARDTLLRVSLDDGVVAARAGMTGTLTAPPALSDDRLLVPEHPDLIASYDARTLALLRLDTLDGPVLAAPAIADDGSAYVLTRDGTLWLLDRGGSRRLASVGGTVRESLTLARNGVLIGRLDGTLVMLRRDGTELWREQYQSSIRAPVALADGAAYVGLLSGRLVKLQ